MQISLQWKQKVQTNMRKIPVLEMQLFIQFNKNQIYYVIPGKLEYIFMNFQNTIIARNAWIHTLLHVA